VQLDEPSNDKADDEMDVSDEDEPTKKKHRTDCISEERNNLKDENESLRCQMEAYKNEVSALRFGVTRVYYFCRSGGSPESRLQEGAGRQRQAVQDAPADAAGHAAAADRGQAQADRRRDQGEGAAREDKASGDETVERKGRHNARRQREQPGREHLHFGVDGRRPTVERVRCQISRDRVGVFERAPLRRRVGLHLVVRQQIGDQHTALGHRIVDE
jgi:hypothetical protein